MMQLTAVSPFKPVLGVATRANTVATAEPRPDLTTPTDSFTPSTAQERSGVNGKTVFLIGLLAKVLVGCETPVTEQIAPKVAGKIREAPHSSMLTKLTDNQIINLKNSFECTASFGDNLAELVFTGEKSGKNGASEFPLAEFDTRFGSSRFTALQLCQQSRTNIRNQLSGLLNTTGGTIRNPANPAQNIRVHLLNNNLTVVFDGQSIKPVPLFAPYDKAEKA